ncbi:type 2 isopentenyl-diphosphate Delta-isomerase [Bacillus fonticola]|uniref:type 2 isopentenyl-diphosphate Delta-isomerase n=1 Tax=Bacillus fonticola TaxID=2728853 RepID=UPI00147559F9|nr:type 2 isopentenyl-diphosphate Delta-isomerase [Bacillus fonticola]
MSRQQRKVEHIAHAIETGSSGGNGFQDVQVLPNSLPNCAVSDVDLSTHIGELFLGSPIFVNAMTGGGGRETEKINGLLAEVAAEWNLAMAIGSQMAALRDPVEEASYKIVRKKHPRGICFANLGSEATVDQARRAVDMIEANALQIHLNVIQELTMPEGDRDFTGALGRIEHIVKKVECPVIVKEVGFGMTKETVDKLRAVGVSAVDVGGRGGTNFAVIENKRRTRTIPGFNHWGISTAASLLEAKNAHQSGPTLASGGIETSDDVFTALVLGADAVGMAGVFLRTLTEEGQEGLSQCLDELHRDLTFFMTAVGAKAISELHNVPYILKGELYQHAFVRGFLD